MGFDLNKREFRDALHLRYDWSIPDKPVVCVCVDNFDTDHAMICKRGGFITMRHSGVLAGEGGQGGTGPL